MPPNLMLQKTRVMCICHVPCQPGVDHPELWQTVLRTDFCAQGSERSESSDSARMNIYSVYIYIYIYIYISEL